MGILTVLPAFALAAGGVALAARHAARAAGRRARLGIYGLAVAPVLLGWAATLLAGERLISTVDGFSDGWPVAAAFLVPAALVAGLSWGGTRVPWARAWPVALIAPVAMVVGFRQPWGGLLLLAGAMGLSALGLPALSGALGGRGRAHAAGAVALATCLGLGGLAGGFVTLLVGSEGDFGAMQAHHAWSVTVSPADASPYVLRVPLFLLEDDAPDRPLAKLRASLAVTEGDATFRLEDDGTSVVVEGRGPVGVGGKISFYGAGREREAFLDYRVPLHDVALESDANATADVVWKAAFSGGEGHSCRSTHEVRLTIRAGEPRALMEPERDGSAPRLPAGCV